MLGRKKAVLTTKIFGIKKTWTIGKMTLKRNLELSKLYARIQVDQQSYESDDLGQQLSSQYKAVRDNSWLIAKVIATAVDSWVPVWLLRWHFYRKIDSWELLEFAQTVLETSGFKNFMMSIFLMDGSRISKPKKID